MLRMNEEDSGTNGQVVGVDGRIMLFWIVKVN
jgi:hypothetical protein